MFLKDKNIIFKIRRSKVTDYAALSVIMQTHYIPFTIQQQKAESFTIFERKKKTVQNAVIFTSFP